MKEETLKLFLENYNNEGICKDLPNFLKTFTKKFTKTNTEKEISYYPWAVIERLFRMQGGEIEIVNWAERVDVPYIDLLPDENGTFSAQESTSMALFIHLHAKWMGEELDEFYPLFDNQNARIIKTPDSLDLNSSRQRGSVRLIGRISGIGLHIFEQQDNDLLEEGDKVTIKVEDKKDPIEPEKPKSTKTKTKTKKEEKQEIVNKALQGFIPEQPQTESEKVVVKETPQEEEPKGNYTGALFGFLNGETQEPEVETIKEESTKFKEETFGKDSEEYASLLFDIRKIVKTKNAQAEAKSFIKSINKELLSDLSYEELTTLKESLS